MTQGWGAATDVQLNEAKASIEAEFEAMRAALQEVALSPLCAADNAGVLRAVLLQAMLMRSNEMQEAANNHFMSAASEVDAQRELIAQVTRGCWLLLTPGAFRSIRHWRLWLQRVSGCLSWTMPGACLSLRVSPCVSVSACLCLCVCVCGLGPVIVRVAGLCKRIRTLPSWTWLNIRCYSGCWLVASFACVHRMVGWAPD